MRGGNIKVAVEVVAQLIARSYDGAQSRTVTCLTPPVTVAVPPPPPLQTPTCSTRMKALGNSHASGHTRSRQDVEVKEVKEWISRLAILIAGTSIHTPANPIPLFRGHNEASWWWWWWWWCCTGIGKLTMTRATRGEEGGEGKEERKAKEEMKKTTVVATNMSPTD
ncbi:unnamed protein product [Hydatigera taeniaeformis]|uniref:DZF domain-containing protein n=1 Tax=Hydatigena taeniaeformis TaxID=6205 RepID=A0A0R3WQL5_HYDTA|nr:unnamed protein product [Hydatigera taeniaeformis]